MTTEQKAKAYDEALERAIVAYKDEDRHLKATLERIFPELQESEGERIKKLIYCLIRDRSDNGKLLEHNGVSVEEALDWIEKQGEQKSPDKGYTFNAIPRLLELIQPTDRAKSYCQKLIDSLEQEGYSTDAKIVRERLKLMNDETVAMATMDEQNPAVYTPKFRVGDLVISTKNPHLTYKVLEVGHINENGEPEYKVEIFVDGKPSNPSNIKYIRIKMMDEWGRIIEPKPIEDVNGEDYGIDGLYHAKEILEKTLGNVEGYQSDDGILEHKCAISAVKKLYEQKPTEWSEEDSYMLGQAIKCVNNSGKLDVPTEEIEDWLKSLKPQPKQEWSETDKSAIIVLTRMIKQSQEIDPLTYTKPLREGLYVWLNSLKDRAQPQETPSWTEEDEKNFKWLCRIIHSCTVRKGISLAEESEIGKWINKWLNHAPQQQWKPNDDEMNSLAWALSLAKNCGEECSFDLRTLYEQLKKLKEE